jgi:hypothetical protein
MMNKLILEKYISVAVQKALKEEEIQQKKSVKSMYLVYRFPGLKKLLEDLMSPAFGRYISDVSITAPKPTTFKIDLINSQSFSIYYIGGGEFMIKVLGKKYYSENIGELERASAGISSLLELNYAPDEIKEEPAADKGAELGAELTAADEPEETPEEETPQA